MTIKVKDKSITIAEGISVKDTNNLIMATAMKAVSEGFINKYLLKIYFNLHMIYMFTDIEFTDEEKEDELALYDKLVEDGVVAAVIDAIPSSVYDEIYNYALEYATDRAYFLVSAAGAINVFAQQLPAAMESVQEIVKSLDEEKLTNIIQLAQANGINNDK